MKGISYITALLLASKGFLTKRNIFCIYIPSSLFRLQLEYAVHTQYEKRNGENISK